MSWDSGVSIVLTMGWTVQGLNPSGGNIFCTCPAQTWGPPILLFSGNRVLRPGRGVDHSAPSSAEVKERVELLWAIPQSSSGPSWPVVG